MGPAENKAIVKRFIEEAFNKGNLDVIDDVVAADYVNHVAGLQNARGPAGMKQFVMTYRTAFPDYTCTIEAQIAEGETVATRWTARGTQHGPLMGTPPTGKHVTLSGIVIDRIANGRLAETWLQADALGMIQQLGVIPTAEPAGV